jgi:hypothetical protein
MLQERLNSLSLMLIECNVLKDIYFNEVINGFAHFKSRRVTSSIKIEFSKFLNHFIIILNLYYTTYIQCKIKKIKIFYDSINLDFFLSTITLFLFTYFNKIVFCPSRNSIVIRTTTQGPKKVQDDPVCTKILIYYIIITNL